MKHYLYRHIRHDNNQVFYIGIGTKRKNPWCIAAEYGRAYSKTGRSEFWKRIISKSEYTVDIMMESENYDFIKTKEQEFIKIYKFKKDGGTLCNLTDGGDGCVGRKFTREQKEKMSKSHKGKKISETARLNMSKSAKRPKPHKRKSVIVNYDNTETTYESITACSKYIGIHRGIIWEATKLGKTVRGYKFKYVK